MPSSSRAWRASAQRAVTELGKNPASAAVPRALTARPRRGTIGGEARASCRTREEEAPMAEIERVSVEEARQRTKPGGPALLVCAYDNEEKCNQVKLEGAIS